MNNTMILMNIGGQEIIIILLIVLVLFGGRKIPELMKGLGKGVREYKRAVKNIEEEINPDEAQPSAGENDRPEETPKDK